MGEGLTLIGSNAAEFVSRQHRLANTISNGVSPVTAERGRGAQHAILGDEHGGSRNHCRMWRSAKEKLPPASPLPCPVIVTAAGPD
jgi:hypothetical protein